MPATSIVLVKVFNKAWKMWNAGNACLSLECWNARMPGMPAKACWARKNDRGQ